MAWPLRERWFWMLFFLLLLALIVPFLLIGLLINFSPVTIVILLIVLAVVLFTRKSYREWKRAQDEQRDQIESAPPQKGSETESLSTDEFVNIKCPYCGNVYDEKHDRCPYCGGKKP